MAVVLAAVPVLYLLSSGPMTMAAFRTQVTQVHAINPDGTPGIQATSQTDLGSWFPIVDAPPLWASERPWGEFVFSYWEMLPNRRLDRSGILSPVGEAGVGGKTLRGPGGVQQDVGWRISRLGVAMSARSHFLLVSWVVIARLEVRFRRHKTTLPAFGWWMGWAVMVFSQKFCVIGVRADGTREVRATNVSAGIAEAFWITACRNGDFVPRT